MTDEAKQVVETIKQAFSVFADMELPMEERVCMLSHDAAMTLIDELERVKRERDALMTDLSKSRLCRTCVFYGDGDYISNDCFDCVNRCNWQWRGIKEDRTS